VGEFKPGIGNLLAGTAIPVCPCRLDGAGAALPKGAWFPRPRRVRLTIGPPRSFGALPPGRAGAEQIARELRQAVMELA
jgi:1-acyl-sn-glycerol-3-phosphate acyltransferase